MPMQDKGFENVFVDDDDPIRQDFVNRIDLGMLRAIYDELQVPIGKNVDEEYQKRREDELRRLNVETYLSKNRLEAQQRFAFKEHYCLRCTRKYMCTNIGAVYECSVYDEEDSEFNNNARVGRIRGV